MAAAELAQAGEEGPRLRDSWVEKQQHTGLEGRSQPSCPPPPPLCPAPTRSPGQPAHPREHWRAAGRPWGGPTGPCSGSAPGPAALTASAAGGGPPRPRKHSPPGPHGHPAAPGTSSAPNGSPGAEVSASLSAGRPPAGLRAEVGGGGQGRAHLDGGLLPLAALKAQGLEHALQESDRRG